MTKRLFCDERGRRTDWYRKHCNVSIVYGWDMERVPDVDNQESTAGPTWADVETVWPRLHARERVILQLVRDGKGPTDVAEILHLADRRRAHEELLRVVKVVRFYVHHADALERLSGCALKPRDRRVAILYARHRMPHREIARRVKCSDAYVWNILQTVRDTLREAGEDDVVDMLAECASMRPSGRGKRRADADEPWRDDVLEWLLNELGRVFYEWGGQKIERGIADCSGLVIEVLKKFGVLPDKFRDTTAQGLSKHFDKTTKDPKPGDLAFYGRSARNVTHVMFYVGEVDGHGGMVAGMCGGRKNMKAEWARKVGAALWLRKLKYRRDFLFIKRVR